MKTFFPVPTHPQVLATNFLKKTPGTPSYLFSLKVLPTSFESTKKWMYKKGLGCTKCTFSGFSGHYKKEEEKKREKKGYKGSNSS